MLDNLRGCDAGGRSGRHGTAQAVELPKRDALRVCADPNLLPFSNDKLEGFENKIAAMIGEELGVPVGLYLVAADHRFRPQHAGRPQCDIVMGAVAAKT